MSKNSNTSKRYTAEFKRDAVALASSSDSTDGATSVPVHGRAYPETGAYPSGVTAQPVTPLSKYTIAAGQLYLAQPAVKGDSSAPRPGGWPRAEPPGA